MSLINPVILYGFGLAAIPVILHFLLRSKPKKLLFPALRLIQMRRKNNTRRMRLRHIWLLLLRVLVIALLVLAIARPSLPAANYAPNRRESFTLAAIALVAAGVYWAMIRYWNRRRLTHHNLAYRKSVLRGATGAGMFLLFLLLFVWPYQRRIAAELVAPMPEVAQNLPVAGVFLFDTSLSMEYRFESKTRLDVAKEIANTQLSRLPQGSRIAVADTSNGNSILFQADLSGALARMEGLESSPISFELNDRLRDALDLQEDDRRRTLDGQESLPEEKRSDRVLREVYVFTDMARSAWRTQGSNALRNELERLNWCQVFIIDVGVEEPTNVGISRLDLSKQTVPQGGELVVDATLESTGSPSETEQILEFYVENNKGESTKQGQQTVTLKPGEGSLVTFSLPEPAGPVVRGEIRLFSGDSCSFDDVRYFTAAVLPPPEILIVSDSAEEAIYLQTALSPPELAAQGKNAYQCRFVESTKLRDLELSQFEVVCLVNVRRPTEDDWMSLASYVNDGGGLALFLGMRNGVEQGFPTAAAYGSETALSLLPARLLADLSFSPAETLDLRNHVHPILDKIERLPEGIANLTSAQIMRYWRVEPAAGASVIAEYTDSRQSPALLERPYGKGRVVMLTTAVDLNGWSELPHAWSFLALADQLTHYLGGRANHIFNYAAGEEVILPLKRSRETNQLLLRKPGLQQTRVTLEPNKSSLIINNADQIGQYRVSASQSESNLEVGFCVNPQPSESDFIPIGIDDLDNLLGEHRYSVARNVDELQTNTNEMRIGKEVFSLVLMIMIAVFCTEHIVANRFYEADQAAEHT